MMIRMGDDPSSLLRKYVGPGGPTGPGIEYSLGTGRRLAAGAHVGTPF